ncbi:MAG: tetratricopeptide repeat protein, partial [Desulfatitalea sp.]|nr:tetratricopeptide repeat protein [Desulfatitalea sp.]NNK02821.1 tetratricopeptide repeat protein [Desulfatitalea sp.]
ARTPAKSAGQASFPAMPDTPARRSDRAPVQPEDTPDTGRSGQAGRSPATEPPTIAALPAAEVSSIPDVTEATQRKAQAARRAVRAKSERIQSLVNRLDTAMNRSAAPQEAQVEAMLHELESIKGRQSPYVQKMRAYWLLKQERHEEAGVLLERILAADDSDLEAALNLVVVHLRLGRRSAALAGLQHIRKAHPDNQRVVEMIRKLQ